ncbi:hypothetical protein [Streptomyces sp. NPDC005374]|uniref:hypothetical protein n=1 Tax=Streptomyces sp. NPDC005374 TaxID=3364713 RepID=UPI0036C46903
MHLPPHHPRYAVAVLVVAALALAGCSAGHDTDGAGASATPDPAPSTSTSPSTSPGVPSPQARPTSLADWPTAPASPQDVPTGTKSQVIAAGYTGQAFLERLAADWHLTLGKQKKLTSGEPALYVGAEGHPTKGSELSVGAIRDLAGDLRSFECEATADAPRYEEFLRACVGLDYPGSDPKAAATWLTGVKPQVDKVFKEEKVKAPITSPLLRAGTADTFLYKGNYSPSGTYTVRLFGAAGSGK